MTFRSIFEQWVHGYLLAAGLLTGMVSGLLGSHWLLGFQWVQGTPETGPSLVYVIPLAAGVILGLVPAQWWAAACHYQSVTATLPRGA